MPCFHYDLFQSKFMYKKSQVKPGKSIGLAGFNPPYQKAHNIKLLKIILLNIATYFATREKIQLKLPPRAGKKLLHP